MTRIDVNLAHAIFRKEVIELLGGESAIGQEAEHERRPCAVRGRVKRPQADRVAEERASCEHSDLLVSGSGFPITPFRVAAIDHLAARLGVTPESLAALLGIAGRTAQRRRQQGALSPDESDRLYRIARVFQRAVDVFGAEESAVDWLKRRQPFFEFHAPLDLLGSDAGAQAVEQELGRIEYGDFS